MSDSNSSLPPFPEPQDQAATFIVVFHVLKWIVTPVYYLAYYIWIFLLAIVTLILRPLTFLALPFIYLGHAILACIAFPFNFLARFETLYIYLSIASLVGIIIGTLVTLAYGSIYSTFSLGQPSNNEPATSSRHRPISSTSSSTRMADNKAPRSAKEYREQKKREQADPFTLDPSFMPSNISSDGSGSLSSLVSGGNGGKKSRRGKGRNGRRRGSGTGNLLAQTIMEEVDSSEEESED